MSELAWDKMGGLLPAVVQDADTLQVLMLGYMNREALEATRATRTVTFFSRSKNRLWTKGESSGNVLELVELTEDCDADALLVLARPKGPTCHRGTVSCFSEGLAPGVGFLGHLDRLVAERARTLPEGSYTTKLLQEPLTRAAQKVGEEGVETVVAALAQDDAALTGEAADLLFHLLVLLRKRGLGLDAVLRTLASRHR